MVITLDSGNDSLVVNTWLPGRILSIIWGKYQNFVKPNSIYTDKLGRWNSFILENGTKSVLIITCYRIPEESKKRLKMSHAQMNKQGKKVKSATIHRMEMLKEISIYIKENSIMDIIIAGDLNKAINSNIIKKWFIENEIYDIYHYINKTEN